MRRNGIIIVSLLVIIAVAIISLQYYKKSNSNNTFDEYTVDNPDESTTGEKDYEFMTEYAERREVEISDKNTYTVSIIKDFILSKYSCEADSIKFFDEGFVDGRFEVYSVITPDGTNHLIKVKDGTAVEVNEDWEEID